MFKEILSSNVSGHIIRKVFWVFSESCIGLVKSSCTRLSQKSVSMGQGESGRMSGRKWELNDRDNEIKHSRTWPHTIGAAWPFTVTSWGTSLPRRVTSNTLARQPNAASSVIDSQVNESFCESAADSPVWAVRCKIERSDWTIQTRVGSW